MPTTGQPTFSPATVAAFDRLDAARARIEAANDERIAAWDDARTSANPNLPRYQAALAESDAAKAEMDAAFDGANEAFDDEIHAALVARYGPNGPSTWEEFEGGAKETAGFGAGTVTSLPGAIYENVAAMERVVDMLTSPTTILSAGIAIGQDPGGAAAAVHRVLDGFLSAPDPAAAAAADRAESRREMEQLLAERIAAIDDPVGVGVAEGTEFSNVAAPLVLAVATDGIGDAALLGDEAVAVDVAASCPTCDAAAATRAASAADDAIAATRGTSAADDAIATKAPPLRPTYTTDPVWQSVREEFERMWAEEPTPEKAAELAERMRVLEEEIAQMKPNAAFDRALADERMQTSGTIGGRDGEGAQARANWLAADDYVKNNVARGEPLTIERIEEMHRIMGDGLRNNDAAPGILRGADPDHAINVGVRGPPPRPYMNNQDVLPAMNELMDWYNANKATMPAPELAGKFYQRMASIHPFTDANGRTSRMAADWILQSEGYPPSDFGSIRLWAGDTGKPTAVEASVAGLEKAVNIYKQVTGEALPVTPAVGGP